jgi:hypothetical protein
MHRRAGFTSAELLNLVVLAAILAAILLGRQQKPRLDGATAPGATAPSTTAPGSAAPLPASCVAITPLDSVRVAADTMCRRLTASPAQPAR